MKHHCNQESFSYFFSQKCLIQGVPSFIEMFFTPDLCWQDTGSWCFGSLLGHSSLVFFADFLFFSWNLKVACLDVILSPLPRGFHLAFWEEDLIVFLFYSTVATRRKISRKSRVFCHTPYSLCPIQMEYDTWRAWEENQASTAVFLVLTVLQNYLVYLSTPFTSVFPTII